jgi:hypothetical protein
VEEEDRNNEEVGNNDKQYDGDLYREKSADCFKMV